MADLEIKMEPGSRPAGASITWQGARLCVSFTYSIESYKILQRVLTDMGSCRLVGLPNTARDGYWKPHPETGNKSRFLSVSNTAPSGGGVNQVSKSLDDLLVERAKRGDVEAFEQLISQYEKKVVNTAYRLTGNIEDAMDVAQEAFIRAYSSIPEFRGDSSFATWLFRIVHNACLDELRKRKRQRITSLDEPVQSSDGEMERQLAVANSSDGPEEALERVEVQRAVQESINALDEEYRIVVVMRDIQGYSYNEIAETLGINLGTVKSRLNRARNALKEMFGRRELLEPKVVYSGRRRRTHEL